MPNGYRLKEIALSQRFGVSRTPIREALRLLEQDGVAKILPAHGAVVVSLTPDDVEDIYDIRMMLELLAIDLIGPTLKLQSLSKFRNQMSTESSKHIQKQVELDTKFHRFLIETTGRRYLITMYERTSRLMQRIRSIGFRNPTTLSRATSEHIELIDALLVRDIDSAKITIRQHIQNSKTCVLSLLHQ